MRKYFYTATAFIILFLAVFLSSLDLQTGEAQTLDTISFITPLEFQTFNANLNNYIDISVHSYFTTQLNIIIKNRDTENVVVNSRLTYSASSNFIQNYLWDIADIQTGDYIISISSENTSGETSAVVTRTVKIEGVPTTGTNPTINLIKPEANNLSYNKQEITSINILAEATPASYVLCFIKDSDNNIVQTCSSTGPIPASGDYSFNWPISSVPINTYTIEIQSYLSGALSDTISRALFITDDATDSGSIPVNTATAPALTIIVPVYNNYVIDKSIRSSATLKVETDPNAQATCSIYDSLGSFVKDCLLSPDASNPAQRSYIWDITNVALGSYSFKLRSTLNGISSDLKEQIIILIDTGSTTTVPDTTITPTDNNLLLTINRPSNNSTLNIAYTNSLYLSAKTMANAAIDCQIIKPDLTIAKCELNPESIDSENYLGSWSINSLLTGTYTVKMKATLNGVASNDVAVDIFFINSLNNQDISPDTKEDTIPEPIQTPPLATESVTTPEYVKIESPYTIRFKNIFNNFTILGEKTIELVTSGPFVSVIFSLKDINNNEVYSKIEKYTILGWRHQFLSSNVPNGKYKLLAIGTLADGNKLESLPIDIEIKNPSTETASTDISSIIDPINTDETLTTETPIAIEDLSISFLEKFIKPLSGEARLTVKVNMVPESVSFNLAGNKKTLNLTAVKDEDLRYFTILKTADLTDGIYTLKAVAKKENHEKTITTLITIENQSAASSSADMIEIIHPKSYNLDAKCLQNDISTQDKCEELLKFWYLCDENEITEDACKAAFAFPIECKQAKIFDRDSCRQHLYKFSVPSICSQANIKTYSECNQLQERALMPEECKKENIIDKNDCEDFLKNNSNLPIECLNKNITKQEDCDVFLTEKQASTANSGVKIPSYCKIQGINNKLECDVFLKNTSFNSECLELDISSIKECELFLNKKYITETCRTNGIQDKAECIAFMHEPVVSPECGKNLITDENECQEFLFNRKLEAIDCSFQDDWLCKNTLREKYLSPIIDSQIVYDAIKEKVKNSARRNIKLNELYSINEKAKSLIPLKDGELIVSTAQAKEIISISEENNLVQAAPLILIFDKDGDGLNDDTELQIGTDPSNPDSDNDGYEDGVEVSSGYNPLGQGVYLSGKISPLDLAILNELEIEHPKNKGRLNADYTISSIHDLPDSITAHQGYVIQGKADANSLVTLYIYSDMPLAVTVKTDEYGNWIYELKEELNDGQHEIYVALNNNTGKVIEKSSPFNFFIKEAKAVSLTEYIGYQPVEQSSKEQNNIIYIYIIISLAMVSAGLSAFIIILKKKKTVA